MTLAYTVAEVVGGILANSLALLADAGHMLTDSLSLALALFAARFALRPPDPERTYGYQRAEILAALANGVALAVACVWIFWEAVQRLRTPTPVASGLMAFVALGGLAVNVVAAWVLRGEHDLNVRAAFLHVVGDALGSVGALVAALLIATRGWSWADPLASMVIGVVIVISASRLVLESVNVLMEGTPAHLDPAAIRRCLQEIEGVADVHDLHVWSLSGSRPLLTAHLVTRHGAPPGRVLRSALHDLEVRFGIAHATLQLEPPDFSVVESFAQGPPAVGENPARPREGR